MSITRKSLIQTKYTELRELLINQNFKEELALLPDLDSFDIADLTYFLTFTFIGISDEEQFRIKITELAEMNSLVLSKQKLDILAPLLTNFMTWLRNL